MWSFSYYTSPILVSILYRRGYFVAESVGTFAKVTTGIGLLVAVSLCMRGLGRSMNVAYVRFAETLENAKRNSARNGEPKTALRRYDFDFSQWPIDYTVKGGRYACGARNQENLEPSSNSHCLLPSTAASSAANGTRAYGYRHFRVRLRPTLPFTPLASA